MAKRRKKKLPFGKKKGVGPKASGAKKTKAGAKFSALTTTMKKPVGKGAKVAFGGFTASPVGTSKQTGFAAFGKKKKGRKVGKKRR